MPTPSPQLDAARDLVAAGLPVFPLRENDKRPAIENWQNLATTDRAQIDKWWANNPRANVGVATASLLVVDVDPRNGGTETFAGLRLLDKFDDTRVSKTQGGGLHLVYALPPHTVVRGGVNKLGKGVDVKSWGGYIVAPGSTIDGRPYQWLNDSALAPAPEWLIARCKAPRARDASAGVRIVEENDEGVALAEAWLAIHAPQASEGERDDTAYKVAARLYDFGVSRQTCHDLLVEWSFNCTFPPLDETALTRIADSAQKNRSKAVGSAHPDAPGFEAVEIAERTSAVGTTATAAARPKLYALAYNLAADTALTQHTESLIDGLLDRMAMSVWYGESNSGKTFLVLDASWHIAAGRAWGEMQVTPGAVAYVAAEGGRGILKRVKALRDRYPEAGDVPLHIIPCAVDLLHHGADLNPLVALIRDIEKTGGRKVELVVIDTLSRAIAGGNENDSADMGALVGHLDALRNAIGAHVAVVHHTGKDKAKGARGHSLLRAATDTEIEIDRRTMTVTKQRDMESIRAVPFVLRGCRLGMSRGKPVTSCTVDLRKTGDAAERVALSPRRTAQFERLREALNTDKIERFNWQFAAEKVFDKFSTRTTVLSMLSEMSESGWIEDLGGNQWVMPMSKTVENVENDNS